MNWGDLLNLYHDLPAGLRWSVVLGFCILFGGLTVSLARLPRVADAGRPMPPTIMPALGAVFALYASFLAHDVYDARNITHTSMQHEAVALNRIVALSQALPRAEAEAVRGDVLAYLDRVIGHEWPRMRDRQASAEAQQRLDSLLTRIARLEGADSAVKSLLLHSAQEITDHRGERLFIAMTYIAPEKWLGVMLLGVLAMTSIAMCTVSHRSTQVAAVGLFVLVMSTALTLIVEFDQPLSGRTMIEPWMFEDLLASLTGDP